MTKSNKTTYEDRLMEASKWIARERAGDMTRLEKAELENLLAHDVDFQLAYLDIYKQANLLDSLATRDGKDILSEMAPELLNLVEECEEPIGNAQKKRPMRIHVWVGAIAASILLLAVSSILFFQDGSMSTIYETRVGGNETIMLKDGSIITLNTDTRISVALAATERRVLLEHGEAYFDVAKDKARPFIVMVGDETVRAVGTAFNIKRRAEVTNVTVTEGIVEVKSSLHTGAANKLDPISLKVGKHLTIDREGSRANMLAPLELEHAISWRKGMLHFNSKRLDDVVSEIQYYASKEIILASDQVSDIIIGGSFNTNNVASFLKGLELNFPIKVIERETVIIISYEKKPNETLSVSN